VTDRRTDTPPWHIPRRVAHAVKMLKCRLTAKTLNAFNSNITTVIILGLVAKTRAVKKDKVMSKDEANWLRT